MNHQRAEMDERRVGPRKSKQVVYELAIKLANFRWRAGAERTVDDRVAIPEQAGRFEPIGRAAMTACETAPPEKGGPRRISADRNYLKAREAGEQ
jgi:hypothetical protein